MNKTTKGIIFGIITFIFATSLIMFISDHSQRLALFIAIISFVVDLFFAASWIAVNLETRQNGFYASNESPTDKTDMKIETEHKIKEVKPKTKANKRLIIEIVVVCVVLSIGIGLGIAISSNKSGNTAPVDNSQTVATAKAPETTKKPVTTTSVEESIAEVSRAESRAAESKAAESRAVESRKIEESQAAEERRIKAEQERADFIASCLYYDYKEISRNPSNYYGNPVVFRGKVIQVLESGTTVVYRVNTTVTTSKYSDYESWDDTIYVTYVKASTTESRILEDDIIMIYGTLGGLETYETIFGGEVTIPKINAKYVELAN